MAEKKTPAGRSAGKPAAKRKTSASPKPGPKPPGARPGGAPPKRPAAKKSAPKRRAPAAAKGGKKRVWPYLLALVLVWLIVFVGAYFLRLVTSLPDINTLFAAGPSYSVSLRDVHGRLIAVRGLTRSKMVSVTDMPDYVPNAFIAIEDRRFRHHFGIDVLGLIRAAYENYRSGHVVQGGSTLTQQLAKNLFLTRERTMKRKVQEAMLALWLESKYSKNQILTLYLNRVGFGAGVFGIEAASERFFGKHARKLSLVEAAILAGSVRAPSHYNPVADPDAAHQRAAVVLIAMHDAGMISKPRLDEALHTRARVVRGTATPDSGYFTDWVLAQLSGYATAANASLVVDTTLDLEAQARAERVIKASADEAAAADAGQVALIGMKPDGAVRVMLGGRSYRDSPFNRAVDAVRQPGSSFKAFVYLTAFEHGKTPDDIYRDGPVNLHGWRPKNYERYYMGDMPLWKAFAESVNTVAAQLIDQVGPHAVVDTARRLGIHAPLHAWDSLALGTSPVSPLELASAYAVFANNGRQAQAYGIRRIRTKSGKVLWVRHNRAGRQVVSPENERQMVRMMQDVVTMGTGKRARLDDRPVAGKTGTTQNSHDAWFAGFSGDYVSVVWYGNDDNQPMHKVTGGTLPAETFHRFMTEVEAGRPVQPLPGNTAPDVAAPENVPAATPAAVPADSTVTEPGSGPATEKEKKSGGLGGLIGSLLGQ